MTDNLRRFYVYAFLRNKDSESGPKYSPYYIGKGCGKRAFEKHGRVIPMPQDNAYIVFIEQNLTERQAFDLEGYCIKIFGRVDLNTGILRNLTNGGDGISGYQHSAATIQLMSQKARGHQRWLGKKHNKEAKTKMSLRKIKHLYELADPNSEIYITENLREFSLAMGLHYSSMSKVVDGKRSHHRQWIGRIIS